MSVKPLTLAAVADLDGGRVREAYELALRRLQRDCQDRPGLQEKRTLTLKLTLVPVADDAGGLDSCQVQFRVDEQLPTRRSKVYNAQAAPNGTLLFNEMSPEDIHQTTLDDAPGPVGALRGTGTDGETVDLGTGEVRT